MSGGLTYAMAFVTGVTGALHCLGMCSGLAGGLFACREGSAIRILQYHAARILVYGLAGMAGAMAGRVLLQQGILGKAQGLVMIAAGILIIALGVRYGISGGARAQVVREPGLPVALGSRRAPRTAGLSGWQALAGGALNGLVPCALTTSVAIQGAASADPIRAGTLMLVFGLGTLPTMALVSLGGSMVGRRAPGVWRRIAALAVCLMGVWTLYEGWIFFDVMRGLGNW